MPRSTRANALVCGRDARGPREEVELDLLERAHKIRDAKVLWMGVDPELDSLHGHPRFNDLLPKLNHRLGALPTLPARSLSGEESIAVLAFRILSSPVENTGDEYLGIGLTDALITRLSNVQRLIVRPTSSVLRYRGACLRYGLLASELDSIPNRFFIHNENLDFVIAAKNYKNEGDIRPFAKKLIERELEISRTLEQIHFDNRKFDYYRTDIVFGKFGD